MAKNQNNNNESTKSINPMHIYILYVITLAAFVIGIWLFKNQSKEENSKSNSYNPSKIIIVDNNKKQNIEQTPSKTKNLHKKKKHCKNSSTNNTNSVILKGFSNNNRNDVLHLADKYENHQVFLKILEDVKYFNEELNKSYSGTLETIVYILAFFSIVAGFFGYKTISDIRNHAKKDIDKNSEFYEKAFKVLNQQAELSKNFYDNLYSNLTTKVNDEIQKIEKLSTEISEQEKNLEKLIETYKNLDEKLENKTTAIAKEKKDSEDKLKDNMSKIKEKLSEENGDSDE